MEIPTIWNGGILHIISGLIGFFCLVSKYGWSNSPNWWDLQKYKDDKGLQDGIALMSLLYISCAVPASCMSWSSSQWGSFSRILHLLSGIFLLLFVCKENVKINVDHSNNLPGKGPYWSTTDNMLVTSLVITAFGYMASFPAFEILFFKKLWRKYHTPSTSEIRHVEDVEEATGGEGNNVPLIQTANDEEDIEHHDDGGSLHDDAITIVSRVSSPGHESPMATCQERLANWWESLHGPLIFGCSAYIFALSLCMASLLLTYATSEPFTSMYSVGGIGGPVPLETLVQSTYSLGPYFVEFDTRGFTVKTIDSILLETIPYKAFVQLSPGYLARVFGLSLNMYYIQDLAFGVSNYQSIDTVEKLSERDELRITGRVQYAGKYHEYTMTVSHNNMSSLVFTVQINELKPSSDSYKIFFRFKDSSEHAFGFGAQLSAVNLKGSIVPVQSREKGIGRGLQPLTFFMNRFSDFSGGSWQNAHTSIPSLVQSIDKSTRLRSITIRNTGLTVFDLTQKDACSVEVSTNDGRAELELRTGKSLGDVLLRETRERLQLPQWFADGLLLEVNGGSSHVLKMLDEVSAKVRCVGVLISDWSGLFDPTLGSEMALTWAVDDRLYPNWDELLSTLHNRGIKVFLRFKPLLSVESEIFKQALDKHCVIRDNRSSWIMQMAVEEFAALDLLKPSCREFFRSTLERLTNHIDGWIAEEGENLPFGAGTSYSSDEHGTYVSEWIKMNSQVAKDRFVLFRTTTLHDRASVPVLNLGFQLQTFDEHDGLASVVHGMLSAGLSGVPATNSYLGGVRMAHRAFGLLQIVRTKELLQRWIELAAFTDPLLLTSEGLSFDEHIRPASILEVHEHVSKFLQIHHDLWSYKQNILGQFHESGLPLVRHMWVHFPDDPYTQHLESQMMIGSEYLFCPVLHEGMQKVVCYLPHVRHLGKMWVRWSRNEIVPADQEGKDLVCDAPIGDPCVFQLGESTSL